MIKGRIGLGNHDHWLLPCVNRTTHVFERIRGLLGRPPLVRGEGLLIVPCPSVHTLFMAYPIDLVFLDKQWRVVRLIDTLQPWRMAACHSAAMTLELAAGSLGHLPFTIGSSLLWEPLETIQD